jgi:hypothetical protein
MVRGAEVAQPNMRFGGDPLGQRLGEPGLAYARLAGNQHHPHTRRAYSRAVSEFLTWCDDSGVTSITA